MGFNMSKERITHSVLPTTGRSSLSTQTTRLRHRRAVELRPWFVVVWLLLGSTMAAPAAAREPSARGVEVFVAEVLQRNPTLRARTLGRDAAQYDAAAAGLWPDPEAAVMLDRVPKRMEGEMPMVRYQLSQMVPWPGKLGLMRAAAERRTDATRSETATRTLDLIRDAKRSYWMLLMNSGLRDINGAGRGLLDTIANTALARYGAGSGAHHDVVRAQVEQSAIDVEAIDLEGERVATVAMLNALRDLPAATVIEDPPEPDPGARLDVSGLARLERLALDRRPELEQMRAMQHEEESMAALARRERYPDLMTSVWYNQMLGEPDTAGVMLGVTLPVFNVRRQTRIAQAAELRAGSVGSDVRAMGNMIRFEVADAARKVVTATRTLELVQEVAAPRANQSFAVSLAGFSTGTVDIVGVLESWRSLQAVERARVESVAGRLMAIAELERAIGGPLPELSP
jgi:cobalt-zinc-cadmium efflux system outer membrane protein